MEHNINDIPMTPEEDKDKNIGVETVTIPASEYKRLQEIEAAAGNLKREVLELRTRISDIELIQEEPLKLGELRKRIIELEEQLRAKDVRKEMTETERLEKEIKAMLEQTAKGEVKWPIYRDRPDRSITAYDFLDTHWGRYLKHFTPTLEYDVLYQDQLGKLDGGLLRGIKNYCKGKQAKHVIADIIPALAARGDREVKNVGEDYRKLESLAKKKKRREIQQGEFVK